MSSTTPENAESWRDLADQLTPEQVAELDAYTHSGTRLYQLRGTAITVSAAINPGPRWVDTGPRWDDAALLSQARHHARENLTAAMVGEVPPPPTRSTSGDGAGSARRQLNQPHPDAPSHPVAGHHYASGA
jgi:hypothetical protein